MAIIKGTTTVVVKGWCYVVDYIGTTIGIIKAGTITLPGLLCLSAKAKVEGNLPLMLAIFRCNCYNSTALQFSLIQPRRKRQPTIQAALPCKSRKRRVRFGLVPLDLRLR